MSVSLLDEKLPVIEEKVGDAIKAGVCLHNSVTYGYDFNVEAYFLRLIKDT